MAVRLRGATQAGDTNELYNCIRGDANVFRLIDEAEFVDTPLHIAAARGRADFATTIMYLKPSLARKLNQDIFSPMHLALQNDHKETMLCLLAVDKDLVHVKGREGYTPLHHVAREGNLDLLAQFLKVCPACVEDVTIWNETASHVAAKHNRLEALEILARWIQRIHLYSKSSRKHLLNLKDRNNNTVLHIVAANTQQTIKVLLECDVDTKETNMSDLIALNVLESQSRNGAVEEDELSFKFLRDKLGVYSSGIKEVYLLISKADPLQERLRSRIIVLERTTMQMVGCILNMSIERINALLVVLALVLMATYQAMLSSPSGVWQGDILGNVTVDSIAKLWMIGCRGAVKERVHGAKQNVRHHSIEGWSPQH
ncbi:ankyrin repeat-containing protein BDA1-like [Herrania umbratica]|uniref:Ankyrin repeat-containing protein BDA1-like n=1 Tax=Herrania umbratica TaxID=108875 RepID=A0A6J1B9J7_9ROSI|nr:ankyrin repeat-containing protein BDA1-like [Herrania umbratica]